MTTAERFEQLKNKYYYDQSVVDEKLNFLQTHCRHVKGDLAGQPMTPEPFQVEDIIKPVFGLYEKKDGPRLINQVLVLVPRKNGKTTLLAGIELIHLFNDGEPGAEIYNCAGDDQQADLLFQITKQMVNQDTTLYNNSRAFKSSIVYKDINFIKKITSKSDTKHGFNTHAYVYDEFHVAPNAELYDVLKTSTGQRRNPVGWHITTAGFDRNSICYQQYEYLKRLLDGVYVDDHFWGVIYEAPEDISDEDCFKEETWRACNPLYDTSPNLQKYLKMAAAEAKNDVTKLNTFKRLHLNIWTSSETKWIPLDRWRKGNADLKLEDYIGQECYLGLDLSSTNDMASLCAIFPNGGYLDCFWWNWIPREKAEEYERRYNIPYSYWEKMGWIVLIEGNVIDFTIIENQILEINENHDIKLLAYDEWNSIELAIRLQDKHMIEVNKNKQGYYLSPAIKKINELTLVVRVRFNSNMVVEFALDNVNIKQNDEAQLKLVKPKDQKKIDPMVSFAMSVNEWVHESLYEPDNTIEAW